MIDLAPEKNVARYDAMRHAIYRANRTGKTMFVYVGPPETPASHLPTGHNVWFVRSAEEGQPEGAELFHTQAPKAT